MKTATSHFTLRPNREGQPRAFIEGTRVRVQDIYFLAEVEGKSAEEIVSALPHLTLGQVHAALSYYFDHREEILEEVRQDEAFVTRLRTKLGPGPLERRRMGTDASSEDSVSSG
jgi:uncharacterized protein (DUF433 family)